MINGYALLSQDYPLTLKQYKIVFRLFRNPLPKTSHEPKSSRSLIKKTFRKSYSFSSYVQYF